MGGTCKGVTHSGAALGRRADGVIEGKVALQHLQSGSLLRVSGQTHMKQSLDI